MATLVHMCVYSVTQSSPTLCNPIDCSPPCSSVHGIFPARIMEWVATSSSRSKNWTHVSKSPALQVDLYPWATGEAIAIFTELFNGWNKRMSGTPFEILEKNNEDQQKVVRGTDVTRTTGHQQLLKKCERHTEPVILVSTCVYVHFSWWKLRTFLKGNHQTFLPLT